MKNQVYNNKGNASHCCTFCLIFQREECGNLLTQYSRHNANHHSQRITVQLLQNHRVIGHRTGKARHNTQHANHNHRHTYHKTDDDIHRIDISGAIQLIFTHILSAQQHRATHQHGVQRLQKHCNRGKKANCTHCLSTNVICRKQARYNTIHRRDRSQQNLKWQQTEKQSGYELDIRFF